MTTQLTIDFKNKRYNHKDEKVFKKSIQKNYLFTQEPYGGYSLPLTMIRVLIFNRHNNNTY